MLEQQNLDYYHEKPRKEKESRKRGSQNTTNKKRPPRTDRALAHPLRVVEAHGRRPHYRRHATRG